MCFERRRVPAGGRGARALRREVVVVLLQVVWCVVAEAGATSRGQRGTSASRPRWRGSARLAPEQPANHANHAQMGGYLWLYSPGHRNFPSS